MQAEELEAWLGGQLPPELLGGAPQVSIYDDELIVMLQPQSPAPLSADEDERRSQEQAWIEQLRAESRPLRMKLAEAIQSRVKRPVAWGMRVGASEALFTARTVPVMTRLDRRERDVLDTLVAAGVAETRSAALAYCVRVFASEHDDWLQEIRAVVAQVQQVRAKLKLRRRQGAPGQE